MKFHISLATADDRAGLIGLALVLALIGWLGTVALTRPARQPLEPPEVPLGVSTRHGLDDAQERRVDLPAGGSGGDGTGAAGGHE